jgi:hypothetical protein
MTGLGLVSSAFGLGCVVLPLGGDWPGLWTDGPTIFGALPDTRGRWLRCLSLSLSLLRSAARWSLFPYVYVDAAYHLLPTELLTVPVIPGRRSVAERNLKTACSLLELRALPHL